MDMSYVDDDCRFARSINPFQNRGQVRITPFFSCRITVLVEEVQAVKWKNVQVHFLQPASGVFCII